MLFKIVLMEEGPQRTVYLQTNENNIYQLTTEQLRTIELIKDRAANGIYVILEDIPEEDLEKGPIHLDTFVLKADSETGRLCSYIVQTYKIRLSTIQKLGFSDCFDANGKRTTKHHSLICFLQK